MEKEINPQDEKKANKKKKTISHGNSQNLNLLVEAAVKEVEKNVDGGEG